MVKEQRGRLTELSRGRQEIVGDYKVCLNWNKLLHNSILCQDIVFKTIVVCNDMDQHEKQSSSTWAIQLWHLSCLFSFIAAHHRLIVVLIFGGITTPVNIMAVRNESLPLRGNLIPRGSHNIWRIILRYGISSNNSRSSNNRLPRTIAPHPPTHPSRHPLFVYLLPVKLKWNLIQQNWSVTIQTLKINQGTKFGTLKKLMFSLFVVIIKQNI